MNFFVDAMAKGGEFMYPILVAAIFALAIAFERLYYVMFRANINGTAFMAQVQKLIMANNIDRAIKLCNAEPHAMLPKVVKAGLTRANRTEKELEKLPAGTKRGVQLQLIANTMKVAPPSLVESYKEVADYENGSGEINSEGLTIARKQVSCWDVSCHKRSENAGCAPG